MLKTSNAANTVGTEQDSLPEPPPECRVILFNDDFTTKDFVISVLISIFDKSEYEAEAVMQAAHTNGNAVIGVYTCKCGYGKSQKTRFSVKNRG